jgi:glycosyltransferase involved in cell wall biosynthesis
MSQKILHLIGQLGRGGAERQMIAVCGELKRRGWQQVVATFCPGAAWDRKISGAGIPLRQVPREPIPIVRLWRLHQIVRREKPDLIHSWSLHTNVYASYLPFRKSRVILSFRCNPTVDGFTGTPRHRLSHAWIYQHADWVVSNSHTALVDSRKIGIQPKRASIVGNIVQAPNGFPRVSHTPIRILAVGSLKPLKGYHDLLQALSILAGHGEAFECILAGDGPERERLQELSVRLKLGSQVSFPGEVEEVPALMAWGDILVHPSHSEGLSNSILEGMASGLPVVATSVGATPEYIEDDHTGLLVPPGQPALLAEKIRLLMTREDLRERLGRTALSRVVERCSPSGVTCQYERVYRSLLSHTSPAA